MEMGMLLFSRLTAGLETGAISGEFATVINTSLTNNIPKGMLVVSKIITIMKIALTSKQRETASKILQNCGFVTK